MKKFLLVLLSLVISFSSFATSEVYKTKPQKKKRVQVCVKTKANASFSENKLNLSVQIDSGNYGVWYADTASCEECSTAGMVNWYRERKTISDRKIGFLTKQLQTLNANVNVVRAKKAKLFRNAVCTEIKMWNQLEKLLYNFNSVVFEINKVLFVGNIFRVLNESTQQGISYARFACLQEDVNTFKGIKQENVNDDKGLLLTQFYANMRSLRPDVKASQLRKEYSFMSIAKAKKEAYRLTNSYPVSEIKIAMNNWLSARKNVATLLSSSYEAAYNQHTMLLVHSLIYNFLDIEAYTTSG